MDSCSDFQCKVNHQNLSRKIIEIVVDSFFCFSIDEIEVILVLEEE